MTTKDPEPALPPDPTDGRRFLLIYSESSVVGPLVRVASERFTAKEVALMVHRRPLNLEWVMEFLYSADTKPGQVRVWYGQAILICTTPEGLN
jgi:hypothetical protein